MRWRRVQNLGNTSCWLSSKNTIYEIDLIVSQNTTNLENLGENENIDVHDDDVKIEAPIKAPSFSKSKIVKRSNNCDDINKFAFQLIPI